MTQVNNNKRGRNAETGHFTTVEEARRKPKTHTVETIPKPQPKRQPANKAGR